MEKPNYIKSLETLMENNHQDHEYSKVESLLLDVINECTAGLDGEDVNKAIGQASQKFEAAINNAWKLVYLIPMITLKDEPEKWIPVEESPLLGKTFRTSNATKVNVTTLERHSDTIDGTPGCIYRINGNSKLAFMLYGNTVIEYDTTNGEDMDLKNNYTCACFVKEFPFKVPYPTVTTIIHAKTKDEDGAEVTEDYGFISDIRNISREEVSADELKGRFFSPNGTQLFPNLSEDELKALDTTESDQ